MMQHLKSSVLFIYILISACTGPESPTLTLYVSADEQIAKEVIQAFTEETGIEVKWVGDSEASKTTGLVARLSKESSRPIADVFWSSENIGTIQLAEQGVFQPQHSDICNEWPEEYRSLDNLWFAFSPRARVIAYNPANTSKEELPSYWWQYNQAAMADPRFGTTGTHLAVMALDEDAFDLFIEQLPPHFLGGNAATVQAVIDGLATFAMTDSDDVHAAIARNASIAMHIPRHHDGIGGGTLLIPNTVAVVANCKHPHLARKFVDFMLSDEVATILASSSSKNIPIQIAVASQFPELIVEDPLQVDFIAAAKQRNSVIDRVIRSQRAANAK